MNQPISSMTGYADLEHGIQGTRHRFMVRSVNQKTLDVDFKVPPGFVGTLHEALQRFRKRLSRGRVTVIVEKSLSGQDLALGSDLIEVVRDAHSRLEKEGISLRKPSLAELLHLGEKLSSAPADGQQGSDFLEAMDMLIEGLLQSRIAEGNRLRKFLLETLSEAQSIVGDIVFNADAIRENTAKTVADRLRTLEGEEDPRLRSEIALACSKADFSEEADRLKSHLEELGQALTQGGTVGKKLDFVLQECRRESGTMTSKAADASVSRKAIALSLLIERMREQVQNLE